MRLRFLETQFAKGRAIKTDTCAVSKHRFLYLYNLQRGEKRILSSLAFLRVGIGISRARNVPERLPSLEYTETFHRHGAVRLLINQRINYLRSRPPPLPPRRVGPSRRGRTRRQPPYCSHRRESSSPSSLALCEDSDDFGQDAGKPATWTVASHFSTWFAQWRILCAFVHSDRPCRILPGR